MKDAKAWDFTHCQIGHPCYTCDPTVCSFYTTYSLDKGQDEKENENERTIEKSEGNQQ